jgi:hypothetical protein
MNSTQEYKDAKRRNNSGKGKRKHQAHVAEEEESPASKKTLVEIEKYVL